MRPFFLDPITQQPLSTKKYYDVISWLTTQAVFSFVAAPFVMLQFDRSITVWARNYYFAVVGTVLSMAFFASPAKAYLRRALEKRAREAGARLVRTSSSDSIAGGKRPEPVLGLGDPVKDIDEAIQEIRAEVEKRKATEGASKKAQ